MASNSVQYLIDGKTITCPACGSLMTLDHPGTYRLVLSEGARHCYDSWIQAYRTMLGKLETFLARINRVGVGDRNEEIPAIPNEQKKFKATKGQYKSKGAEGISLFQKEVIDFFGWEASLLQDFPQHSGSGGRKIEEEQLNNLLAALEPPSAMGPIVSLVFEQEDVAAWIDGVKASDLEGLKNVLISSKDNLDTVIEKEVGNHVRPMQLLLECALEVAPNLTTYFTDYLKTLLSSPQLSNRNLDNNMPGKLSDVVRALYLIVIILGHRDRDAKDRTDNLIAFQSSYKLPRLTEVTSVDRLISSVVTLDKLWDELGLDKKFIDAVKGSVEQESFDLLGKKGEIQKIVNFVCMGDPADTIKVVVKGNRRSYQDSSDSGAEGNKRRRPNCGWSPKSEDSHAVVLLGGPATSKTSVMVSGMTCLEQHIHAIGASQDFDTPTDEEAFQSLFEAFWQRSEVEPTEPGSRQSVKLSVTDVEGKNRTHFVFTDLAGEAVADLIKDKKSGIDPAIERRLKKAEIIVFFLDICLDNALREPIVAGQKAEIFYPLLDHIEKARADRNKDKARLEQKAVIDVESSADVPQLRLLGALLRKLEGLRQSSFPNKIGGVKFILVVPKCDFYVHPNMNVEEARDKGLYFLTPVFSYLRERNILVDSRNFPGKGFAGMITTPPHKDGSSKGGMEIQRQFLREISDKTRECLCDFGSILGSKASEELQAQMSEKLEIQLVKRLESVFDRENVFFLPVSARGGDFEPGREAEGSTSQSAESPKGGPVRPAGFNQKLSEYVFLAPILLALSSRSEPPLV